MGNKAAVHEMKEMSLFLGQKAHARAPGVVSASSPICSPSSSHSFCACHGRAAFSAPPELCPPLPALALQFPGSWWHIQTWQCHFPAGVSQAPPERGHCWQCPRMPGEQSDSPCCHAVPKNPGWAWWVMVWAWQRLLPACLGPSASSWAGWSRSWKPFSCCQLHSLCPETHSGQSHCSESLSRAAQWPGPSFPTCPLGPGLFSFQPTAGTTATTQCCSNSSESKASCMSLLHP